MTLQIFKQAGTQPFQYAVMYTAPAANLGVQGTLFVVNKGNPTDVEYGTSSDVISVGLSNSDYLVYSNSWISWNTFMPPQHMAQWQNLCLEAGQSIFIYSEKGQSSFTFTGTTFDA
jgi:hypothetical protein